jgi:hypothetical protein
MDQEWDLSIRMTERYSLGPSRWYCIGIACKHVTRSWECIIMERVKRLIGNKIKLGMVDTEWSDLGQVILSRGGDDDKPYVWPSTGAPPVVAPCTWSRDRQVNHYIDYVKWTTTSTPCVFIKSPSATFVRERNPRYRSSRVSLRCYHLVDVLD